MKRNGLARVVVMGCAALVWLLSAAGQGRAELVYFTSGAVFGFVPNTATPAFLDAIGGTPDEFISFATDRFGAPIPNGPVAGTVFSNNVVFSTGSSSEGSASPLVRATGPGTDSQIGPVPDFSGTLVIDFLAAGQTVDAVGFGPVSFEAESQIRIFDDAGILLDTRPGVGGFTGFTFFGVVATGPERIGRVELEGSFFGIQDIQFNFAPTGGGTAVPEPSTLTLLGLGLAGVIGCGWRRKPAR